MRTIAYCGQIRRYLTTTASNGLLIAWSFSILDHSWDEATRRPEIAAFILNSIPPAIDMSTWLFLDGDRGQCMRQWELLNQIITGEVTNLPPNAMVALVYGIAKTYLYNPAQSPALLVDLLEMPSTKSKLDLKHAIGVALTVAAFANHEYPRTGYDSDQDTCLTRAKKVYDELVMIEVDTWRTESILTFGLFGMLAKPIQYNGQDLSATQLASVVALSTGYLATNLIPTLPINFDDKQHTVHVVSDWLDSTSHEPDDFSVPHLVAIQYLEALLCPALCGRFGDNIRLPLIEHFSRTESLELKKLCLRGVQYSLGPSIWYTDEAPSHLANTNFLAQLLELTMSTTGDIVLHSMHFLWVTAGILLDHVSSSDDLEYRHPAIIPLLKSLDNVSTVNSAGTSHPQNIGEMGFMDLWITKLADMCHGDLQKVIDSEVFKDMIYFYKEDNSQITPHSTTVLPGPYDSTWTWLRILQHLEGGCTAIVKHQTEKSFQEAHEHDLRDVDMSKHNDGTCMNLYWSM